MDIGKPFADIDAYNSALSNTLDDKLFFLEHLPEDDYIFVDFGCADGTLLRKLQSLGYNDLIGYDISREMLEKAKSNSTDITYTSDWLDIVRALKNSNKKSILILSSVIHEVYSYAEDITEITDFWGKVKYTGFDYVVIRDMIPSKDIIRKSNSSDIQKILEKATVVQLIQFQKNFGSICNNKNLVHFLLKYRYTTNWNREVHENYFPIFKEDLLKRFYYSEIVYIESFKVPFLESEIDAIVVGGHGDTTMVPVLSEAKVNDVPVAKLLSKEQQEKVISDTMKGGATLTSLIGTSAWQAPASAISEIVSELVFNENDYYPSINIPCSVYREEYGLCIGTLVTLTGGGVKDIKSERDYLSGDEYEAFLHSVKVIQEVNKSLNI